MLHIGTVELLMRVPCREVDIELGFELLGLGLVMGLSICRITYTCMTYLYARYET